MNKKHISLLLKTLVWVLGFSFCYGLLKEVLFSFINDHFVFDQYHSFNAWNGIRFFGMPVYVLNLLVPAFIFWRVRFFTGKTRPYLFWSMGMGPAAIFFEFAFPRYASVHSAIFEPTLWPFGEYAIKPVSAIEFALFTFGVLVLVFFPLTIQFVIRVGGRNTSPVRLAAPRADMRKAYQRLIKDWEGDWENVTPWLLKEDASDFNRLLERWRGYSRGEGLAEDGVPN